MPNSSTKYQGTVEYFLVYSELIQAARYRGLTTYQSLAQKLGMPARGVHLATEIGQMLDEINQEEARWNRPMLSALCVGVSGEPGGGFYNLARSLGKLKSSDRDAERRFWHAERDAVYDIWARKFA